MSLSIISHDSCSTGSIAILMLADAAADVVSTSAVSVTSIVGLVVGA